LPRILYATLNVLAFAPIIALPTITAIAYLTPDYARASNIGLLGYAFAPLTIVTALSLPINLVGGIYFGIHQRDRALSIALLVSVLVVLLVFLLINVFPF